MRIRHYMSVSAQPVEQGAVGVTIREVITPADGAPTFSLRVFEVDPGGSTPRHAHSWEHEVFVLAGRGVAWCEADGDTELGPGDTVLVAPEEAHQFRCVGDEVFRFICLIPNPPGSA